MKKLFSCMVIIIMTIIANHLFINYCVNNIRIHHTVSIQETSYPEYANKILGIGGFIKNNTIFPVKIKKIMPLGMRGMKYVTAAVSPWGFSETTMDTIRKLDNLDHMIIPPLTAKEIAFFYEFTGDHAVNPTVYEIHYTLFGIPFKKIDIHQ